MMYGPQAALIAECFPPRLRYSGSSLGFHLSSIIAGGPAPLIATALFAWTGSGYSIALYILFCAVISFAATIPLPDYTNRDISQEPAYGSVPVGSAWRSKPRPMAEQTIPPAREAATRVPNLARHSEDLSGVAEFCDTTSS